MILLSFHSFLCCPFPSLRILLCSSISSFWDRIKYHSEFWNDEKLLFIPLSHTGSFHLKTLFLSHYFSLNEICFAGVPKSSTTAAALSTRANTMRRSTSERSVRSRRVRHRPNLIKSMRSSPLPDLESYCDGIWLFTFLILSFYYMSLCCLFLAHIYSSWFLSLPQTSRPSSRYTAAHHIWQGTHTDAHCTAVTSWTHTQNSTHTMGQHSPHSYSHTRTYMP